MGEESSNTEDFDDDSDFDNDPDFDNDSTERRYELREPALILDGRVFYSVIFVAALATLAAVGMLGGFSV
ncbi:hypothetical protein [Rhodococcus globerulus]|uniref:Uncharacterized protein n=1 Tax=Rhodococcus globerulus TaxID=33008 RepID=A0ABU4BP00_RHOGO|nr:hypothetical protein [Rhodococcus globerulus]MDV6265964.1 hypothetical protein [Rhodococcus globerulus]